MTQQHLKRRKGKGGEEEAIMQAFRYLPIYHFPRIAVAT